MTLDIRDARGGRALSDGAAPDLAHPRAEVLAAFLEQVDAAARLVYDAIRQLPGYRDLDEVDALHVLRSIRWVLVTLIGCLREQRQLTGREVARLHDIGVTQARRGVPSEAFRLAFSLGARRATTCLRAVARDLGYDQRVADTIERDLVGPLADAANVREDGFAQVAADPHESVRRDEADILSAGRRVGAARHG